MTLKTSPSRTQPRASQTPPTEGFKPRSDAEASLRMLVVSAPAREVGGPYKQLDAAAIDQWLATHFGARHEMTPSKAAAAAKLLQDYTPGVALETREHMLQLISLLRVQTDSMR